MPELKGWKTGAFFALALVIGIVNQIGFADFQPSDQATEWYLVIVPLIGLILRTVTTSSAGWRK